MRALFRICFVSSILATATARAIDLTGSGYILTCQNIASSVSNETGVYYFGECFSLRMGNKHWPSSSSQDSACVVEPANINDMSTIMKIVANASTPFGIRSGGHATNPGFSSTPGVQIALFRLDEVTYHTELAAADGSVGTVDIGAGLTWDTVYAALEPYNVNVVGGRVTGVGVGGFVLGGGYSWLSNQYGLAIDTVVAFEIVLPNGTITTATETVNPDLYFGLKGGFNNFGVVTKFTLRAFPQQKVWGGLKTFTASQIERVSSATLDFVKNNTDPKANIITAYNFLLGQPGITLLMFYDGPIPPNSTFAKINSIPTFTSDVSTRSFLSLVQASPSDATYGSRGAFSTVSLKTYSPALLKQVLNQTDFWGMKGVFHGALFISYAVEPFLPSMNARSKGGAYPHDDHLIPLNLYFAWLTESHDDFFMSALKESTRVIFEQAVAEGQDIGGTKQIKYGNYALGDESLASIYGPNLGLLKMVKAQYDPGNVMALAGGYRL
ncbi:FAD-binding domain-containing protein [Ceratobasidium sp. AG-I]|nr:FAD-binding domain-containing protein [Ceratobasidium sp. AG-I]